MAQSRHKRAPHARRMTHAAAAVASTVAAVTAGVVIADPMTADSQADVPAESSISAAVSSAQLPEERAEQVTRSLQRYAMVPLAREPRQVARLKRESRRDVAAAEAFAAERRATRRAVRAADTRLWTTEDLTLWSAPEQRAKELGLLEAGEKVLITGRRKAGREELAIAGQARWVTAGYLSDEEPVAGIGGECTNGSSVPSGVSPNITKVHAAVCSAFPEITTYGTFRADGEHSMGIAVDIMVSGSRGWEVAEFVRANYAELGVNYAIYSQNIWSVQRGGEGWRGMADRGSTTANHYDHVHVTTY